MKTQAICLAVIAGLLAALSPCTTQAGTAFSVGIAISNVSDFYEPLAPYGHWVYVADYGRCWYPAYVPNTWQPYGDGQWEWTDQGWYWVSDEPWAWATYHYGRWIWDPYYGWLWVPDIVWAPAWVAWREGCGYYGWAPLPPARFCAPTGIVMWECVSWFPRAFIFVEFGRFCHPVHYRHHGWHWHRGHHPVIHQTINITQIQVINNTAIHRGPPPEAVQQHIGRPLQPRPASELWQQRSEQVIQRASLDRAPVPPMVPTGREHRASPPSHRGAPSVSPQTDFRRGTQSHGAAPAQQSPTVSEHHSSVAEPRRSETPRPTFTRPSVITQRQDSSVLPRADVSRPNNLSSSFQPRPQLPPPQRSRPVITTRPSLPPSEQRFARSAPASPPLNRSFESPPQRPQPPPSAGGSSGRSERSSSGGLAYANPSDSRDSASSSLWGTPTGGDRMGFRGGRR